MSRRLNRILVVDDLFGRQTDPGSNYERLHLCGKFLLRDVSSNSFNDQSLSVEVLDPVAEAVFHRGQLPTRSRVGDLVQNDLEGTLRAVREGWVDNRGDKPPWCMVLLDLCFYTGAVTEESNRRVSGMPEGNPGDDNPNEYFGLCLLEAIHREFPELPVMILSSKPREDASLAFSNLGASGFIKRDDPNGSEMLQQAIWTHGLITDDTGEMLGQSLSLMMALREARRASGHSQNVLIRGERGTGKELMARYVHRVASRRSVRPFVAVNSAVLTQSLFSSELFGIEPRTATGVDGKIGLIELADRGDLFLDEIADMEPEVQAGLLRVLQDKQVKRVGGRDVKSVDVRFLSATNVDIEERSGAFRRDLLDRLNLGGTIRLPPLRDRPSDIPILARAFLKEAERELSSRSRNITNDAADLLVNYEWTGNIRELRTVIFDAVSRYPDVEHLVSHHLRINDLSWISRQDLSKRNKSIPPSVQLPTLSQLIKIISDFEFDSDDASTWAGQLDLLQVANQQLMVRLLEAALEATKRRTPLDPSGIIQIHPAVKLLTGDRSLSASRAADIVKRILGPMGNGLNGVLNSAYQTAVRLRPKSSR